MRVVFRNRRRVAVTSVVLASAIAVWMVGGALSAAATDARLRACGLDPATQPRAMFQLVHASDIRQNFPNVPDLPELAAEPRSAWVIVVDGPVTMPHFGPPGSNPAPAKSIVCVIMDNVPTVYSDLDLSGMRP